jgi:hypothetical protein
MRQIFIVFKLREGAEVQYVGVKPENWHPEWGDPEIGVIEDERLRQEIIETLEFYANSTHWISKDSLGSSETDYDMGNRARFLLGKIDVGQTGDHHS